MISAGKIPATGGGNCWERGNVCNDRDDYPICVGTQNEGGPLYGMQQGYFGMENIPPNARAKIFTPGTKFKDVQGVCRGALKKPQADGTQDYDYFFYRSFVGEAGALAIFNQVEQQTSYQYERSGFDLTVGEMKTVIEALGLRPSDFKIAEGTSPSKDIVAAALPKNIMKKPAVYLFLMDHDRLTELIDKLGKGEIAGLDPAKRKALIEHLTALREKMPEKLQKKAEGFQVDENEKSRTFQASEGDKGRASMKEMTEENKGVMYLIGGLSLFGILVATSISTIVMSRISRRQIGMMAEVAEKQLRMMRESLDIQTRSVDAIQSMDQKPKITDVASDLVEETKRQFAEDVAEQVNAAMKTAKEAADKAAKTPGYVPTTAEAEAQQLVAELSGATALDAQALSLLGELAANRNHEALVNHGAFTATRDVAERAAYLIATGDSRVPQAMQGRGIWWETDASFDVVGRREEALQLARTLARGQYQNAFVAGETGVGKFEVVRALAVLIARDDPALPTELRGKRLWTVNNTAMIAGTKYRGTFADKQQVLEHAMFKDGDIVHVEELRTQLNAGATMQGDAEQYSAWLLRTLTKKESRFIGDGKPDDYDVIVGEGAQREGLRDFRRRLQRQQDVGHMHPRMILKSLQEQLSRQLGREKNCTIEPAAVEAAVRLGIVYRDHVSSPPFDAAKSALLNAVMIAREGVPEGTKFTVTVDHVVRALEQGTGMKVDWTAGAEVFDATTRPHTGYPHLRTPLPENGNGNGNGKGSTTQTVPFETRVNVAKENLLNSPEGYSEFGGQDAQLELVARKAMMLWDMIRTKARDLIKPYKDDSRGQFVGDAPKAFVDEVTAEHDAAPAAIDTEVMSTAEMTVEMARQDWFRQLGPERQREYVIALREAARHEAPRKAGFITPEGMFTVEGQNRVFESMGFKEKSLEPVQIVRPGGNNENRREEVEKEREELVEGIKRRAAEAAKPGPKAP